MAFDRSAADQTTSGGTAARHSRKERGNPLNPRRALELSGITALMSLGSFVSQIPAAIAKAAENGTILTTKEELIESLTAEVEQSIEKGDMTEEYWNNSVARLVATEPVPRSLYAEADYAAASGPYRIPRHWFRQNVRPTSRSTSRQRGLTPPAKRRRLHSIRKRK